MQMRAWVGLALCGLGLTLGQAAFSADDEKEVPFPKLPKGAGEIDKDAPKTFTKTASGLKYRILRKADGVKPKLSNRFVANYVGWLDNGKVFDSSYTKGEPLSLGVGQVIDGWKEGLQLVNKGGMIELEIPAKLGYGARGAGKDVPPNATLHFITELIDVK